MTLTRTELDAIIAEKVKALPAPEPLSGEVLPKQDSNIFIVSFKEDSRLKNIMLKFDTDDRTYNRWFVTMSDGVIIVKPMPMDERSMTDYWSPYELSSHPGYIRNQKRKPIR